MENIDEIFKTCLDHFVAGHKSERQFALAVGLTPDFMNKLRNKKKTCSDENKRKVAGALGYPGSRYEIFLQIGRNLLRGLPPDHGDPTFPSAEELVARGFMKVDFSENMKLAAGGGGIVPITEPAEHSKIIIHWPSLGKGPHRPHHLQAFRVGEDSMEPLIGQGGIVVVDKTQNKLPAMIKGRSVYVLCWDVSAGECAVKYLRWAEKNEWLSIESENSLYKPEVKKKEDVTIIGRVIWSCREH
jgi:hypothetical protein